ncbi:MAG: ferrous iron transport protein B [Alkalispirochaeta sp.]
MKRTTDRDLEICLVGNPNSGKTTIFNTLTGAHQRVGNWPGVTVEVVEGTFEHHDHRSRMVDLPGIYSLHVSSEDERVARDYLLSRRESVVVNILDATNLERNLYLTAQLRELGVPMVVVMTMADLAERKGIRVDVEHLSHHLGVPVLLVDATSDRDMRRVRHALAALHDIEAVPPARVAYPEALEAQITMWEAQVAPLAAELSVAPRWLALKALEGDRSLQERLDANGLLPLGEVAAKRSHLESVLGEELDIVIADARFGFVHGITRDVVRRRVNPESVTERVDRIVLHPVLGIPVFFFVMYAVFWVTIALGGAAIDLFDIIAGAIFVEGTRAVLLSLGAPGWMELFLADGIGAGLQTVATFVPIIFAMFFMLSLLENSGYMARAAFVMDRVMRWIGLPGKSFVPLLVGFGCTVPAIISTRTLENRKDRMMTVFIAPLMSCGARLPVYALFAAAFFPRAAGLVVFSLYLAGIVVAVLTGLLLKHTLFPGEASHLVMELPPYHAPNFRSTVIYTWTRMRSFVTNAGTTIAVAVAILGILNSVTWPGDDSETILSRTGKAATPMFASIGIESDNWPATVGLFTGLFAKEAIVGTLNSLYSQAERQRGAGNTGDAPATGDGVSADGEALLETQPVGEPDRGRADGGLFSAAPLGAWAQEFPARLSAAARSLVTGLRNPGFGLSSEHGATMSDIDRLREFFGPVSAYSYLLFVLLYLPCLAAFGAALKELGPAYGWLLGIYLVAVAWSVATLFYQFAAGHHVGYIIAAFGVIFGLVATFVVAGQRNLEIRRA